MSDLLRPCDCEAGFCNRLPNPFDGHICRQDAVEMAEELDKAHRRIEQLERENEALIESIKKREPWFGAWMPDDVYKRLNALREQEGMSDTPTSNSLTVTTELLPGRESE